MKITLYAGVASLVASASFAGGYTAPMADIEPVAVTEVTEVRADADWTGFYAGLQYGQGSTEASALGVSVDTGDFDALGLHAGYLRDFGQFIAGGELSYDNVELDDVDGSGDLWRLRGRAGYDMGKFQPYVTLGVARLSDDDVSETGFTYGIGAEYLATNNFSFGIEYSRTDFSDVAEDETGISGIDLEADLVQIRASYRF